MTEGNSMTATEQELAEFWDDFAEEYEEIQQESPFPIAQELSDFLFQEKIFPCQTLLDVAGGSGRYLSSFQEYVSEYTLADISPRMLEIAKTKQTQENVCFLQQSQEALMTSEKKFQVVFSAMNPALDSPEKIRDLCQLSQEWCLIFRLIEDQDSLFSPYEQETNPQLNWMEDYKNFLKKEKQSFFSKQFSYEKTEEVSKSFFHDYFEDQFTEQMLNEYIRNIFGSQETKENQHKVVYELIYIPCGDKQL